MELTTLQTDFVGVNRQHFALSACPLKSVYNGKLYEIPIRPTPFEIAIRKAGRQWTVMGELAQNAIDAVRSPAGTSP